MNQKLFYFLCTVLLSVETGWCSGKMDLRNNHSSTREKLHYCEMVLDDNHRYTIFSNNWTSFDTDIIMLKNNIKNSAVINSGLKDVIKNGEAIVYSDIPKVLEEITLGKGYNISEYIKFATTLAVFGRDAVIIKAAYDIAVAVMKKIDSNFPIYQDGLSLREYIIREVKNKTPLGDPKNTAGVINNFREAYLIGKPELLDGIIKFQRDHLVEKVLEFQEKNKNLLKALNNHRVNNSTAKKYNNGQPKALKKMLKKTY